MAKVGLLPEDLLINWRVEVVAVKIFGYVVRAVCRAAGGIADSKDKGDDDDNQQADEDPATVADEVVLYPGNHFRGR